jgi:hypothetical protein
MHDSHQTADDKRLATLRALAAMAGYGLHRSDPRDGAVTFFVARLGVVHQLPSLECVHRWLERTGGGAHGV